MKIPLFDLDGTLTMGGSGNPIHRQAYDYALHTVYNLPTASFNEIVIDGMLDPQIVIEVAKKHGYSEKEALEKRPQAIDAITDYFLKHKDEHLVTTLKGAKEILEHLQSLTHCGVLTGNIEKIALVKLEQAGLRTYISFGAFGNMALKRVDLIPIAQQHYEETFKETRSITDFVIIGDTPNDIACAKAGGISVISVATGNYTKEQLEKDSPNLVVDALTDKDQVISFLSS